MKTKTTVKVMVLAGFLVILSTILFAENVVKLSTYYPAPYGAYDRLKLVPRESLPLDPNCDGLNDLGTMYYDKGIGLLPEGIFVCQKIVDDNLAWVSVSGQYY